MKNEHMRSFKVRCTKYALGLALLGASGLVHGQQDPLAELASNERPVRGSDSSGHAAKDRTRTVVITDDGHRGDERTLTTSQLVLAMHCDSRRTIAVDIFDEQGAMVQREVLTVQPGHRALAVGVTSLRQGRYAARISGDVQGQVVRFQR